MEDQGSNSLGFHSDIPKSERLRHKTLAGPIIEKERDTILSKISTYEIDLSQEPVYERSIQVARDDIKRTYEQAGVELATENFPKVSLIPSEYKHVFNVKDPETRALFRPKHSILMVFFDEGDLTLFDRGDPTLLIIESIHHEIHHAIGKQTNILTGSSELDYYKNAQSGHHTQAKKDRGLVLEEGVVTHYSHDFIMNSNDSVVKKAREEFATMIAKIFRDKQFLNTGGSSDRVKELCEIGIREFDITPPKYKNAKEIIQRLSSKSPDIERLLLSSRINPRDKRFLAQAIDKVFRKDTARDLFSTPFEEGPTKDMLDKLTSRVKED
jgi:hypothetical protein